MFILYIGETEVQSRELPTVTHLISGRAEIQARVHTCNHAALSLKHCVALLTLEWFLKSQKSFANVSSYQGKGPGTMPR